MLHACFTDQSGAETCKHLLFAHLLPDCQLIARAHPVCAVDCMSSTLVAPVLQEERQTSKAKQLPAAELVSQLLQHHSIQFVCHRCSAKIQC